MVQLLHYNFFSGLFHAYESECEFKDDKKYNKNNKKNYVQFKWQNEGTDLRAVANWQYHCL